MTKGYNEWDEMPHTMRGLFMGKYETVVSGKHSI